jgi:hypothetical protein
VLHFVPYICICALFNDAVSNSRVQSVELYSIINKYQIEKDMEGSGRAYFNPLKRNGYYMYQLL